MKILLVLALTCAVGCVPPINVEAPMIMRVDDVELEPLDTDPPYAPTVRWKVSALLPGNPEESFGYTKDKPNGDNQIDGRVFNWGGVKASLTIGKSKINLDCSTGAAGTIYCLANEATMTASCERMVFKFTCTRM